MSGNPGGDDPLPHIFYRWQSQMLCRGDIAEEIGSRRCSYCPSDGGGDVVVSGGNIGGQGSQHIEGCPPAKGFLKLNIKDYLIQRDMAGTFNHYLHILVKGVAG